jgi:phosphotransferase system  glucose/maltose/N-acetylglucosamine-specific IIC component
MIGKLIKAAILEIVSSSIGYMIVAPVIKIMSDNGNKRNERKNIFLSLISFLYAAIFSLSFKCFTISFY